MITFLQGTLEEKSPARVVLNVQGVGYELLIPLTTYDHLPPTGDELRLLVHESIREDSYTLFGFLAESERDLFTRLLSITGIGPKLALSVLSGLTPREFKSAVIDGDIKRLSSVSGIGKRTAERIIVEFRHKLSEGESLEAVAGDESPEDARLRDAVMALISLGYKQADATKMAQKVLKHIDSGATVEELVRHALTGR
jgi:Holliday junction DNA helicase RuvA